MSEPCEGDFKSQECLPVIYMSFRSSFSASMVRNVSLIAQLLTIETVTMLKEFLLALVPLLVE